ncbi:MAG: hypothetical protein K0S53_816 [Bacteroidetes bacterium]|jgi:hypothetical protein|nr:hypothetical protein [Bacteroidota bacterium]
MKRFNPTLICISLLTLLCFVTTITILSCKGIPPKEVKYKISHLQTDTQNTYAMSGATVDGEGPEGY